MMAPYAIGHLKMSFVFEELGYTLKDDERFKLYLTNTLEMEDYEQIQIPGLSSLSEESYLAGIVKKEEPILVILGNPPYSGMSANTNDWTEKLLKEDYDGAQSYYTIDGEPLGEKKVWLQDDYVKFLRFAQWKIHKAGRGIVGMITNHSYLNNPTFRGMRQSLMNTFDEIYILDLHGNSQKKETAPDGGKDENVFDIRQGVAIAIFIKHKNKKECKVSHTEIYGLREKKYEWLNKKDTASAKYKKIKPESPWYFFIPRNTKNIEHYLKWKKINEIFPVNNVGIVTARDKFAIDYELQPLKNRISQFRDLKIDDSLIKETFELKNTSTFKLNKFRTELSKEKNWQDNYKIITYRPFDNRHIYYSKWVIERPIFETMHHMLKENIALISARSNKSNFMNHFFITDKLMETKCGERTTQSAIFPLYLYPEDQLSKKDFQTMMLFEPAKEYDSKKREVNIAPELLEQLENSYGKRPTPEQFLYYIYAVFYSNKYREKYAEFLKIDFPRVPFTSDFNLFKSISKLGNQLADLHLLKSTLLSKPVSKFKGKGENIRIEKVKYNAEEERVYINNEKYFDSIQNNVWEYQIGGYQVLEKYLKDRKDRLMDDPRHYCNIVTAIVKTIEIQSEIDKHYDQIAKKLIV
jgi:predicted helicase